MRQYLDIVDNVLKNGQMKGNRTGVRTLTTFCEIFRHDMSKGFPLLTTKKMAVKTMAVELEGFISGITDKGWYQERKCKIWNEWANPVAVNLDMVDWQNKNAHLYTDGKQLVQDCVLNQKEFQKEQTDLGPIYGYQWRKFNKTYTEGLGAQNDPLGDWNTYTDQLKTVVNTLKKNPNDRRMVVSAWNPNQIHLMALPPCHYAFTLVHINGVLNLSWKQRSCDLMLGVPFNIASYALLLELLCKESGLIPGELVGVLEDCHIYENQIEVAKAQLQREPRELPELKITGEDFNIFNWTHTAYQLTSYNPHPKLDFGPVAV